MGKVKRWDTHDFRSVHAGTYDFYANFRVVFYNLFVGEIRLMMRKGGRWEGLPGLGRCRMVGSMRDQILDQDGGAVKSHRGEGERQSVTESAPAARRSSLKGQPPQRYPSVQ